MKRPKRRKNRYNPYTLENSDERNIYIIKFKDYQNKEYSIEVDETIFNEFNKFELKDLSEMNEYDRHIEHINLSEEILNKRKIKVDIGIEELVLNNLEYENIYNAIQRLPKIQRKRIIMYYFMSLTQNEIAKKEKTSIRAIQYSLNNGLKNLKKFLKKDFVKS